MPGPGRSPPAHGYIMPASVCTIMQRREHLSAGRGGEPKGILSALHKHFRRTYPSPRIYLSLTASEARRSPGRTCHASRVALPYVYTHTRNSVAIDHRHTVHVAADGDKSNSSTWENLSWYARFGSVTCVRRTLLCAVSEKRIWLGTSTVVRGWTGYGHVRSDGKRSLDDDYCTYPLSYSTY
jgi:hypothetical protein